MYAAGMRWRQKAAVAAATLFLTAGCAQPAQRTKPAGGSTAATHYHCTAPFNAGGRIPRVLNPAYPRTGLYPASGAIPPQGPPGVTLRMRAPALVATYGQPLATAGAGAPGTMTAAALNGAWWQVPIAAGFTFRLFGPTIPVFGVVPAPVLTGRRAIGGRYVWMVTQWDAVQALTLLRGSDALAAAAQPPKLVPTGVSAANERLTAEYVQQAEASGWRLVGSVTALPACGAVADHLSPFGARAALKLPLGVPLQLVSPEYGGVVMEVTAD